MFLLTLGIASFGIALVAGFLTHPTPLQKIQKIIRSDASDTEKMELLRRYVKLGDAECDVEKILGSSCAFSGGVVQHTCWYADFDLVLSYRWDGTLFYIGYAESTISNSSLVYQKKVTHTLSSASLDSNGDE